MNSRKDDDFQKLAKMLFPSETEYTSKHFSQVWEAAHPDIVYRREEYVKQLTNKQLKQRLLKESLSRVVEFMSNEKSFSKIYQFIISEVSIIASETGRDSEYINNIKSSRSEDKSFNNFVTAIFPENQNYHDLLAMYKQEGPELVDEEILESGGYNGLLGDINLTMSGLNGVYDIYDTTYIRADKQYQNYLSTIIAVKNEADDKAPAFIIRSTPSQFIHDTLQYTVREAYRELNQTEPADVLEKIKLIKKIAYYLFHLMTQNHESLEVTQMLLEANLQYHNIEYKNPSEIPVNLVAVFSTSFEKFSSRFIINPEIKNTKKSIPDDVIGTKQFGFFREIQQTSPSTLSSSSSIEFPNI